ncbi:MAG: DUF3604 domain-containing protein [bacterium]|nr:DUF3604 domain-containing protein [bacterium]
MPHRGHTTHGDAATIARVVASNPAAPGNEHSTRLHHSSMPKPLATPTITIAAQTPRAPRAWVVASMLLLITAAAPAQAIVEGTVEREACNDRDPERRAFFGDLHVHTAFSLDASTMGTRTRPEDAYRFAWGERIGIQPFDTNGRPMRTVQLERPIDFAAVTDHAELLGETRICNSPGMTGYDSMVCRIYRTWPRVAYYWMNLQAARGIRHDFCGEDGSICREAARTPWRENRDAAEAAYDRSAACRFTSFHGYEWTGGAGLGNNFHRNVIFANDVVPEIPASFIDRPELVDFWGELGRSCRDADSGCDVLVIPHNSNLGAGRMFRTRTEDGGVIGRTEVERREAYERLVEIMQHKGESECMFGLGTQDELCRFEKLEMNSFGTRTMPSSSSAPVQRQFVRNILKEGLRIQNRLGTNPFKFGFIASTDTHLGTPGLAEEASSFPGHGGAGKPPGNELPRGFPDHIDFNPGGLAAVWSEENSRSSLFAAMKRRETFGTSGPRITVRFFGGWDYPETLCDDPNLARKGYAGGVPMGGDLAPPPHLDDPDTTPTSQAPTFAVSALRDTGTPLSPGTPLQQVQIIKGWLEDGRLHERVYEVAGDAHSGAGVDLDTCRTWGTGSDSLCSVWRDPDFDARQPSFYYARVIENPTCRWSQRLCIANHIRCHDPDMVPVGFEPCCEENHRRSIHERAWTSPIWYTPQS